ncbi:MAG: penicillin acylase family protein [Geminicoccaceae bacterium]|nr:penicillin acylase family protein [Geminicoccaceae bacterium]
MKRVSLLLSAAVLLALLLGTGSYLWLRRSLPEIVGERAVPGLAAPVDVLRDAHGVPHVFALNRADAYRALGFVHAQDRLFQMDMQRRLATGRLAEVAGPAVLASDRFYRTLGLADAAEKGAAALDPWARGLVRAYAEGINAFLATRKGPLPPEFLALGYAPDPWSETDVLAFARLMAWDLGGNWRDERLRRHLAAAGVANARIDGLLSPDAAAGQGSNNWAVGPGRSATGGALLANDPHLALRTPSPFYLAHLEAPGLRAIGGTLPGLPPVILGRNARIAWAFTTTHSDVQDLFVERVDPNDPARYLAPGGGRPFAVREERIRVRGAPDEVLRVRATRHGPVLSDLGFLDAGAGEVLALAWTGLRPDDRTPQAMLAVAEAGDWPSFVDALADFHSPQQNILYADVDGHIGFIAPGRVPGRGRGDGRRPVLGWTGADDWRGFVPYDALPKAFDPPKAYLATANNRIVGDAYPYLLAADWPPDYRVRRIVERLKGKARHDPADFAAMQTDTVSLMARELLPPMLASVPFGPDERRAALDLLRRWDGDMRADRPEPLLFYAWYQALARAVYADELGPSFPLVLGTRPDFMRRVLNGDPSGWCDDVTTPAVEGCPARLALALDAALSSLRDAWGDDPAAWRWGEAHPVRHAHALSPVLPAWARGWLDIRHPAGGDAFSPDVAAFALGESATFEATLGPTYRAVYDMAAPERSRFLQTTGQSGNPLSPRYDDFASLWQRGETIPMTTDRKVLEREGASRLRLLPVSPPAAPR